MIDNLKMDLYRLCRQKSFYVTLLVMLICCFLLIVSTGFQSNMPYASYHKGQDTLIDFLYYWPKCAFSVLSITIFYALFQSEEYTSGFAKNIYSRDVKKWKTLMEKWIFSLLTALLLNGVCILFVFIVNIWVQDSYAGFSILQYLGYLLVQGLLISAVNMFLGMVIHMSRSKVTAILLAVAYGLMGFFMLHILLISWLPESMNYLEWTIFYVSGNLPSKLVMDVYMKTMGIALVSTLLYNFASYMILRRKDLA